jgi:hypothetical protein
MKAGIFFTGTGPIVILTNFQSFTEPKLLEKLATKGIRKFVAYELPVARVQEQYGEHFTMVVQDLKQTDDCRVLDFNGHHVLQGFRFAEWGPPVYHEP